MKPELQEKMQRLTHEFGLAFPGKELRVYCTDRTPEEQAGLFRQGRSGFLIDRKISAMIQQGFSRLAKILHDCPPQFQRQIVTEASPGESWHNWGAAFDAVPIYKNHCEWDQLENGFYLPFFKDACQRIGLYWGESFGDSPHFQLYPNGNALQYWLDQGKTPAEIESMLLDKWGQK